MLYVSCCLWRDVRCTLHVLRTDAFYHRGCTPWMVRGPTIWHAGMRLLIPVDRSSPNKETSEP